MHKLKVLFVCSGNAKEKIGTVVKNQGDSLLRAGVDLEYFPIIGKGIRGYLRNIPKLNALLRKNKIDAIHTHYSKSAYVATIANLFTRVPIATSLMGSDIQVKSMEKKIIHFFSRLFWKATIVKSKRMRDKIGITSAYVVPNGVNLKRFTPIEKQKAAKKVGFDNSKKNIVFIADPARYSKNYELAKAAISNVNNDQIILHTIYNVDHELIPFYMYAADVLLLTSRWEGSPNVIKEAMACNLPIVSTDVGDIKDVISDTEGCFVCEPDVDKIARAITKVGDFKKRTNGRENILYLDDQKIASQLIKIYKSIRR